MAALSEHHTLVPDTSQPAMASENHGWWSKEARFRPLTRAHQPWNANWEEHCRFTTASAHCSSPGWMKRSSNREARRSAQRGGNDAQEPARQGQRAQAGAAGGANAW